MEVAMSDIALLLLSLTSCFLFLYLITNLFPTRKSQSTSSGKQLLPPGKTDWPFFSETLDFYSKYQKNVVQKFVMERCKRYSSKIFKTSLIGQPVIVISGAEGNKFLFSNQTDLFKHWFPSSIDKLFPNTNEVLADVSKVQAMRKFLTSILKGDALREHVRILDATIKQQLHTDDWNGEQVIKVGEMSRRYSFATGCKIFLGIEDQKKVDGLEELIKLILIGLTSIPINFPGTAFHRAMKSSKKVFKQIDAEIRQRKIEYNMGDQAASSGARNDFVSYLVQSTRDHGLFLTDVQIATLLTGLLIGSYWGIHATITNVFKHLADFPQVYDLVLKEQEEISSSKGANETLQWEDVRKMKYSWKVVCETLRLFPTEVGGFKEAITDFNYEGYTIPQGWKIHWNINATHHNPEYFPNPEKFDPSRFEGDGPAPYAFVPFGGGVRMCPGNEYARSAILIFLHNVVTNPVGKKTFPVNRINA
ncbi:OLC1v1009971C1 [Oldenlandia corymbosa var. corymbosa]|uniref:OLC1v1009971C1 n=1 Tax=Oldenlandia corymbosa var. corymbosa TaxID=529605 RepID=A0AAV1DQQ2_OLDCO|nr:OLC1v1009971C1 [Oldenlandia corymbosa var. corymbosa]